MKNKKSLIVIGVILVLLIIGIALYLTIFSKNDESKNASKEEQNPVEDKLVAPAENTSDLLNTLTELEVTSVTADDITFSENTELNEGERVAVWLYSEPKFLGYFEIIIKDGVKKIEGLEKALEGINVEVGKHNIAIVKEDGKEVGYIDIFINDDGLNENEVKEIEEKESIDFKTTKQEETNMKSGSKEVVQKGEEGEKVVTYKVTYDENKKEISREKVDEKITKEPVEQIEKVGVSDFNLKTDMLTEISFGPACKESELTTERTECDIENNLNLPEYYAVKINNTYYITSIKEGGTEKLSNPIKVSGTEGILLKAKYNGTQYYFYMSGGGGQYEPLTKEMCSEYKFKCGTW